LFNGYEITTLREKKRGAELGMLSMKLFEPPAGAHWGQFNDRPVDGKAVKELVSDFERLVDNCTDGTAIDIAVKKAWLDPGVVLHKTVEGMRIAEVHELKFTEAGQAAIAPDNLWILGGNHRREAVQVYVNEKKRERDVAKKRLESHGGKSKSVGGGGDEEGSATRELEELKAAVKKLEEAIAKASVWVVKVYDRGEVRRGRRERKC
jgi:hypothetical protein